MRQAVWLAMVGLHTAGLPWLAGGLWSLCKVCAGVVNPGAVDVLLRNQP